MSRDPALLDECRALQRAVGPFPTLTALHSSPEWKTLGPRFRSLLGSMRRHDPPAIPPSVPRSVVRAVHWNVEHGNWYDQVERALLQHPDLADADLLHFNEIDLGMARAGNRDVTADLCRTLGRYGVWAPMFLETTLGRDDDSTTAAGRDNEESLFGLAILSRWPIGEVRVFELPSPEAVQFDLERMVGRHVALVAEVLRPGAPFVAVTAHLEVHRTRQHRALQIRALLDALVDERRPIILSGDFNTHTFDRGLWHSAFHAGLVLFTTPGGALSRRFLHPDEGAHREPLFDLLKAGGFAWAPYVDYQRSLQLRFDRVDEARAWDWLARLMSPLVRWAVGRGTLRLDWFAGRGWRSAGAPPATRGRTISGLDGPGCASDHAPIVAEFE